MSSNQQFFMAPSEFILLNTTDEVLEPQYRGHTVRVPKSGEITLPNEKAKDKFYSAKDADGEWIPGSVVARDMLDGDGEVDWKAREAIRHILGMDIKSGRCTSKYWERGLCYLQPNPTKEQINKVYAEGRKRFEKAKYAQAKTIVDYYAELNESRKRWGAPPIPAGDDYVQAARTLNEAASLQVPLTQAAYELVPQEPEIPYTDESLKAFARAKFEVLAAETATELGDPTPATKDKLVEAMMADETSMAIVRGQYKRERKSNKKSVRA